MFSAILDFLLPDNMWTWIALGLLAALIAAIWLIPLLKLSYRIGATAGLLTIAMIGGLYSAWQGAETRAETFRVEAAAEKARADGLRKRAEILERAAKEKEADDTRIDKATEELKDAIDDAAKTIPPGTVPDAASIVVTCRRLHRTGQTGSPEYLRLCR